MTAEVVCKKGSCFEKRTVRSKLDIAFEHLDEIEKELLEDQLW